MPPDLHVVWKSLPGWQTMVGTQSGQQAAKLATSPPSTPPAPASVSDAHRGQCTHPGFVGQECQESRLLLTSLLLPSKVLPPPPLSHCCSASQLFYKPAGRAVWVAACISRDTVFDLMLQTVTWLLQSEAAMPAVRKRAEGHRLAHCSMLRFDEALRVGCGRLGWVFKSRLNVKSLTPWNVLVILVNRITR